MIGLIFAALILVFAATQQWDAFWTTIVIWGILFLIALLIDSIRR